MRKDYLYVAGKSLVFSSTIYVTDYVARVNNERSTVLYRPTPMGSNIYERPCTNFLYRYQDSNHSVLWPIPLFATLI